MPISKRWIPLVRHLVEHEFESGGAYELGNSNGAVVYVGSSTQVKTRLLQHMNNPESAIRQHATQYRIDYTNYHKMREQQLYDEHVRLYGSPPLCNNLRP